MSNLRLFHSLLIAASVPGVTGFVAHASETAPAPAIDSIMELRVVRKVNPTFPQRLIDRGIGRGEAHLAALVDGEGRLVDTLVVAYTEKEFADAALSALGRWKFEPAQVGGQGASTVLSLEFQFELGETLVRERRMGDTLPPDSYPAIALRFRPRRIEELDGVPRPVHVQEPKYLSEWRDAGISGRVTLSFFIDEQGRPRMPVALKSPHPLLAAAAIEALEQWQFDQPTARGRPALVRVQQEFVFSAEDPATFGAR